MIESTRKYRCWDLNNFEGVEDCLTLREEGKIIEIKSFYSNPEREAARSFCDSIVWDEAPPDILYILVQDLETRKLYNISINTRYEIVFYPSSSKEIILMNNKDLLGALSNLIRYAEINVCQHEEVTRGGAIWTICDSCGSKWADDEGGMPEFEWPKEIEYAREVLDKFNKLI